MQLRKAVFPVAGLGTRFLPATKSVPKEMLPIVDRPIIQYAVDEAIEALVGEFEERAGLFALTLDKAQELFGLVLAAHGPQARTGTAGHDHCVPHGGRVRRHWALGIGHWASTVSGGLQSWRFGAA